MINSKNYDNKIECVVECSPKQPSTVTIIPGRKDTFYKGNPDFKLDLSNFEQDVDVSGFYRIHGVNYNIPQTLLMISSKETGKLLHTLVVDGIHEFKTSMLINQNINQPSQDLEACNPESGAQVDKTNDELIKGLKSEIDGKSFFNARCDNLAGIITCKPLTKKGVELPTQYHLCGNLPSAKKGYIKVEKLSDDHILNLDPITNHYEYSGNKIYVDPTPITKLNDNIIQIDFYKNDDQLGHRIEYLSLQDNSEVAPIFSGEASDMNLCTYFA